MKIIVLAGGLSPERDVSLLSGAGICKTLREMGHQAFLLDVFFGLPYDSDKLEEIFDRPDGGLEISKGISTSVPDLGALRKSRPDQSPSEIGPNVIELCQMADITFMALHGSIGENGKLQATFDNLGIKYTGPNSLGCTLSMNKLVTKQIFKTSGVPTPRGTSLTVKTKDTRLDELGYYLPLVVKPCSNGSSIGVYICHTEEDYYDAIHKSFDIDNTDEVVIEPFIKGREFACGILAGKALPLVEIVPKDGLFDYANKYQAGGASEICPPISLDAETQELIQRAEQKQKSAVYNKSGKAAFPKPEFASITMTGIKLITTEPMDFRNTTVVGLAVAVGMGVTQANASLAQFPEWVTTIFGKSPVVLATIVAIVLNLTLPKAKKKEEK